MFCRCFFYILCALDVYVFHFKFTNCKLCLDNNNSKVNIFDW